MSESTPDLAFLDIKMSGMDGFQFLLDLDAFQIDIEKLRIVVLSDDLDLESKLKLANFGSRISAYLSQSLTEEKIEDVLQKLNI